MSADRKDTDVASASFAASIADVVTSDTYEEEIAVNAEGDELQQELVLRLCKDASHLQIAEETSLIAANSGSICGRQEEESSTAGSTNNQEPDSLFVGAGRRNVESTDEKENRQSTRTARNSRATNWHKHQLGVPLSLHDTSQYFDRPDRRALQRDSSLHHDSLGTFDGRVLCSSLESNLGNAFDERPISVSSLEQDRRVDTHCSSSSSSTIARRKETANTTKHDFNKNVLSSKEAPPISGSTVLTNISNDRSTSPSDERLHSSLATMGNNTDIDFATMLISSTSSTIDCVTCLPREDFSGRRMNKNDRSIFRIDEIGEKQSSEDNDKPSTRDKFEALKQRFKKQNSRHDRKAKIRKSSKHSAKTDCKMSQENAFARQSRNVERTHQQPKSRRKQQHDTSRGPINSGIDSDVSRMLRSSRSSTIDRVACFPQGDCSGINNGEATSRSDDAGEKPTSKDISDDKQRRVAKPYRFVQASPRQRKPRKRKSSSHVAQSEPKMGQKNSTLPQSTNIADPNAERSHKPPESRATHRGRPRRQMACCTFTESSSNNHNTTDVPMLMKQQTHACGSGIIPRNCPKMNSSPRKIQPKDKDVIFGGQGIATNQHNQLFRAEVHNHRDAYVQGNPELQGTVVSQLRESVQNRGGRFLNMVLGRWVEMNDNKADNMIRSLLTENDVIYGRGVANACTRFFREQVSNRCVEYVLLGDDEDRRTELVNELIASVRNRGGLFLKKESTHDVIMNESALNERIRQSLRDRYRTLSNIDDNADTWTPVELQSAADVIYAGAGSTPNARTQLFRQQVRNRCLDYVQGNEDRKTELVNELKHWVRHEGGRVLVMDTERLFEMNESAVNERIRQSLRDSYRTTSKASNGRADVSPVIKRTR